MSEDRPITQSFEEALHADVLQQFVGLLDVAKRCLALSLRMEKTSLLQVSQSHHNHWHLVFCHAERWGQVDVTGFGAFSLNIEAKRLVDEMEKPQIRAIILLFMY